MPAFNFVRRSFYRDSVTLMRLSSDLEQMAGVTAAAAMMATPANRALLAQAGLLAREGEAAGPADLIVAVVADCVESADAVHEALTRALEARAPRAAGAAAARSLEGALRVLPDANVALISVPGLYAGAEARRALRAGLHVMLFSDNVPVETEIELKRLALERGRLMLGPDCGTAILDGVPLGFANAVPRGRIGLAAASGTGLQEVTSLIAREGEGVSHALGVGGRDLSDAVGAPMMLRALELLVGDAATDVVCVLGKPPGRAVARRIADALERLGKPCVVHFPGAAIAGIGRAHVADTLEDAGRAAVALARGETPTAVEFTRPAEEIERLVAAGVRGLGGTQRFVRGVYAGGTLAAEAVALLDARLRDVAPSLTAGGPGHRVTDLGEDAFTLGRPHPMLDGHVRREWIAREGRAADTAVVLVDVVLGSGTGADPAGELLPAIRALRATCDVAGGDARLVALLTRLDPRREAIERANAEALARLTDGLPVLVDCRPAREALDLADRTVLHAGPPIDWGRMCEPMRAAVLGAIRYEGWAANDDTGAAMVAAGAVRLAPCHHHRAVGPMTGIITPSMPVFAVENRTFGTRAHATINEGLGKVLRFGANDASVIARLRWLASEAGPLLGAGLRAGGGIDLRALMAQALRMGDEMHQRNVAASSLLARALMPGVAKVGGRHHAVARLAEFIAGNDQFFLNLAMAAGKALADPAAGIAGSTLVTTMARNGTDFGIRVSALGDRWLTAPVNTPDGLYFPGFGPADANPDMGDSAIVETVGLGGLAMAASPAVARFVGAGGMAAALAITEEMREIAAGEHPHFRIATLDERGSPVGIDVRRVVDTGILPLINTGIAGRTAGVGQVGAGVVRAPLGCFTAALEALAS